MTSIPDEAVVPATTRKTKGPLIYRQSIFTRFTHWIWAICLFFLLLTGLGIFNAHPTLNIGQQSGFEFDNAILAMYAVNTDAGPRGKTRLFGQEFDTTGIFGMSGPDMRPQFRGFPAPLTIPSFTDLATSRVIHFFFAWLFVATMLIWFVASFINGHIKRDLLVRKQDIAGLPQDIVDHATLNFHHGRTYGPLQRLAYFGVFFILFPLIIITGLSMSPGINSITPWLLDLLGGRQTARTIHFIAMALLVGFFIIHIIMVVAAGPINELRSMLTGWYRASPGTPTRPGEQP